MKKYTILVLITTLIVSCSNTKKTEKFTDLNRWQMVGSVKSCEESSYEAIEKFGLIIADERLKSSFKKVRLFNPGGFITQEYVYIHDTTLYLKFTKKYDFNNNIIKDVTNDYLSNKERVEILIYDELGKKIENSNYDSDGKIQSRSIYFYDKDENMIERRHYDSNGNLTSKDIYKYDKAGNNIESINFSGNGEFKQKNVTIYDDNGYWFENTSYDKYGNIIRKEIAKNDQRGNCLEYQLNRFDNGFFNRITRLYDNTDKKIEESNYHSDGSLKGNSRYTYDSNGNIVEVYNKYSDNSPDVVYSYSYKYDGHGNWIEEISFRNGSPESINVRKIVYY